MKSAGNDIVALQFIDAPRTREFRFYSKILSSSEKSLYERHQLANLPFENFVWLLWSIKESVYKYLKRNFPNLLFSPTKFCIQDIEISTVTLTEDFAFSLSGKFGRCEEFYCGKIIFGTHILYFRSQITADWIASVVNDDQSFRNVCWGINSIKDASYCHQSEAVRALLLVNLRRYFNGNLEIAKHSSGYPVVLNDKEDLKIPVSLSHDGYFIAYSFKYPAIIECNELILSTARNERSKENPSLVSA